MKRLVTIGIWTLLLAIIVLAAAPTQPPLISPSNNSIYMGNIPLSCSGSTDADSDPINYLFWEAPTTPIAFYRLDQTTGAVRDEMDNFNASNTSITRGQSGIVNNSIQFGAGSVVYSANNLTGNFTQLTVSAWAYFTDLTSTRSIFSIGDASLFRLYHDTSGTDMIRVRVGNSSTQDIFNTDFLPVTGRWYHFVFQYDTTGGNAIEVWIDDVLEYSSPTTNIPFVEVTEERLRIGNTAGGLMAGYLDEIGLWETSFYPQITYNRLLANSTTDNYNWSINLSKTDFQWACQACDDNGDCSNNTPTRDIGKVNFSGCAASGNLALNLTFLNESNTNINLTGDIDLMSLNFNTTDSYDYTFTSLNTNGSHLFCLDPDSVRLRGDGTIGYSASNFPHRTFYFNSSLQGNETYDQVLYLLSEADGIYTTFQVFDSISRPISGVLVQGEVLINGVYQDIVGGLTDDAGSVTFWVNPDANHRFTFSREGYNTYTTTITPTQSVYTITLTSAATLNETNYNQGITFNILPEEFVLDANMTYNFTFNLTSQVHNLTEYGFLLVSNNGTTLANVSATNTTGGIVNSTVNTTNYTSVDMNYYWTVGSQTQRGSKTWSIQDIYQGDYSLLTFFDDLLAFTGAGMSPFTLALITFILIFLITASVTMVAGIYSPLGILGLITAQTWFFDIVGLIPAMGNEVLGVSGVSVFMTLLFGGYVLFEYIR